MKYQEQLDRIAKLPVEAGQQRRFGCFGCGGSNTLGVKVSGGTVLWQCFRAGCDIKGRTGRPRTAAELRQAALHCEETQKDFQLPDYVTHVNSSMEAVNWMRTNNVLKAWQSGLCEVKFDPRASRIIFTIRQGATLVDAVGRALNKAVKPKWLRYGQSGLPLVVGRDTSLAVIVEDAASACAVSGIATGVALMGTHLSSTQLDSLKKFDRCIVALDPDATRKAMQMQASINAYVPTKVVRITDDLKYFDEARIRTELRL